MLTYDEIFEFVRFYKFNENDFMVTRDRNNKKISISCISDVCDCLLDYQYSKDDKRNIRKMSQLETTLTKSGIVKLNVLKDKINKHNIQNTPLVNKEVLCKSDYIKEMVTLCDDKNVNLVEFKDKQILFLEKMQKWGEFGMDDRRYYLHMIFRYYLNRYHEFLLEKGIIRPFPSYQYILDNIYPNGCKNGFPPEFSNFIKNSSRVDFKVNILPVPIKGCGKNVSYENNFELIPEVSSFRRSIHHNFMKYEEYYTKYGMCVLPEYMLNGNNNQDIVYTTTLNLKRNTVLHKDIHKLDNIDKFTMGEIVEKNKNIINIYDNYCSHNFVELGEQLEERFGYFVFNRSKFFCMDDKLDIFFQGSSARMSTYMLLRRFCDRKDDLKSISENDKRDLIICLKEIVYIFYLYSNLDTISNSVNCLKECINNLS